MEENLVILLFYYLITLNIFDAFITWFGMKNSFISELNPLMNALYEHNPALFLGSKITLSLILLLFILLKKVPLSRTIKGLTLFAAVSYTLVFGLHSFWLIQLI